MKNLQRRIAFILALSIPLSLTGCKNEAKNNDKEEPTTSIEESIEENIERITPEDITSFLARISEITPIYNLEEVFLSDEELNELIEISKNNKECDNTLLDSYDIFSSIILNSLDENGLITTTDDLSESERKELDIFIRGCLKQAIENKMDNNEISLEDACIMKKLRIVIGKTTNGSCICYYGKDKVLVIDYQKFSEIYPNYSNETLKANLIREGMVRYFELGLNFPRYQSCDCRISKGQVNICIGEGNVLNCLIGSAFYSGDNSYLRSVNKNIFDSLGIADNHNTSILLLLAAFKENRNIEDLYQIVFASDLPSLYKYFNLNTEEDIEKFYKIARTIEVLTTNNGYKDEFYAERTSTNFTAFRDYVGYGYKVDVFKSAISDLMKYIANNKDLNEEEAMFLYKFVKHIIVNNSDINNTKDMFELNYVKEIMSIENIYFEFLSKFYGLTIEEVEELYDSYHSFRALEEGETTYSINGKELIERFPLLQYIATNYIAYNFYLNIFDEQTNSFVASSISMDYSTEQIRK